MKQPIFEQMEPDRQQPISAQERQKRMKALNFARASMKLSGFNPSPEAEARSERFVAGEIDLQQFVNEGLESSSDTRCVRLSELVDQANASTRAANSAIDDALSYVDKLDLHLKRAAPEEK